MTGNGLSEISRGSNGHLVLYLQTDKSCLSDVTAQYENTEDLHSLNFPAANFKLTRNPRGKENLLPV